MIKKEVRMGLKKSVHQLIKHCALFAVKSEISFKIHVSYIKFIPK